MIITLGTARTALAKYAGQSGKCATSEEVKLFVHTVVQQMLHHGAYKNLKKWSFCLCDGCFTAPRDMELPLKVKINGYPEKVWNKWYEFYDVHNADMCDNGYQPGLFEEINEIPTAYEMPSCGARVAVIPLQHEEDDAFVIVQGLDDCGRDVYTTYKGEKIHGEKLKISRENPVFSKTTFTKITAVEKSVTCNYVRLYWQRVANNQVTGRGLLAEYAPGETNPSYRRFRVPQAKSDCCVSITILGRVSDSITYSHDNDVLPVTNFVALQRMAQMIQAEDNEKIQVASYFRQAIEKTIEDENEYHRTGQEPLDFFWDNSPGAIENLQ